MKNTNKWINRMFCIFLLILCEVANHFVAVSKIWVVKGSVVVEGLNIINLYAIYDLVTVPEQPVYVVLCVQYESKKGAKIRNQYNQKPHLTKDTKGESNNHTREPRCQPFPSRWPQGSNEQTGKHDKHNTEITQMIQQRSTALERSVKVFYWSA